ncbi:MAG: inositol monophosphatase [Candidatus Levybacteria bacterium]|nr:inositol monophosphatase [Candidatus Levybacteria bacterium]
MRKEYKSFLIKTLQHASEIANDKFGKVSSIVKQEDNNQVLTETDITIGKFIIEKISEFYSADNIIDEEAGIIDKSSDYTWVVDPIDGTSNFASGVPMYGIIIGLLYKDQPIAGGVTLPYFNEIIVAEKDKGTYCNGKKLIVTQETRLLSTLIAYAIDGHQENPTMTYEECKILADIVLGVRNLRAAGSIFDGIMVAKGKYGGYLNRSSRIWDNVGQQLIIEEAGGIYTDFFGKPMDYSNPLNKTKQNFTLCTGAYKLYKQLQTIIHKNQ